MTHLPPPNRAHVVLVCESILCRLDSFEQALQRIVECVPSKVAESLRVGYRLEEDAALIELRPRPREPVDLVRVAIRAAQFPGLRTIPHDELRALRMPNHHQSASTPSYIARDLLEPCDTVIQVTTGPDTVAQLRAALGMVFESRRQVRLRVPVEVRYRGPNGVGAGMSENLSLNGAYVRTTQPAPALGTTVPIAFLARGFEPIRAAATIVHVRTGPGAGFGARLKLSESGHKALTEVIQATSVTRSPEARRAPQRAPARLHIDLSNPVVLQRAWRQEISQGRIFVPTCQPPRLESHVQLAVKMPDGETTWLSGRVVQIVTPAGARRGRAEPGCGLTLPRIHPATRALFELHAEGNTPAPGASASGQRELGEPVEIEGRWPALPPKSLHGLRY